MSQGTFPLSCSQSGTEFSEDLNNILSGINSTNSGPLAPTSGLEEGVLWLDTTIPASPVLKIYDASAAGFIVLGVNGDAFRTVAIYKNGATPPTTPLITNTILNGTLDTFTTNTEGWELSPTTPSSGNNTYTSIGTFRQIESTGNYTIQGIWSSTAQLSGEVGSNAPRSPIIGFYVPMVTRNTIPNPDTFSSALADFDPTGFVSSNIISTTIDNQSYLDSSFSQFFFGNLTSDPVDGDYGVFYNNSDETKNIVASYDATSDHWVTGVKQISGNLLVDGSITADAISADAITGKTVSGGKSSLTDATSGFFLDSGGEFVVGGDEDNQLKWDGTDLTVPALTITGTLGSTQIADGAITTDKIQAGSINADLIEADSITAEKIASLELSIEKNITVGNMVIGADTVLTVQTAISGSTILSASIPIGATTIPVADTEGFPATGTIAINGEIFVYTGFSTLPAIGFVGSTPTTIAHFLTDAVIEEATITVDSTADFPETGTVFLGSAERFTYTSKTATTFVSTIDPIEAVFTVSTPVTIYVVRSGTGVALEGSGRFAVGNDLNAMTFDGNVLTISGVVIDANDLANLGALDGKVSGSLQTYVAGSSYGEGAVVINNLQIWRSRVLIESGSVAPVEGALWQEVSKGVDAASIVGLGITANLDEINTLDGLTSSTEELNILDGVTATATEINLLSGETSLLAVGTAVTDALAGNTTTITTGQASEITANTAKTGITSGQASAITANSLKTGITSGQASEITANTLKTGITSGQTSAITANSLKTGITSGQASEITANSLKTGITSVQASAITANSLKTGITSGQASEITANSLKTGITSTQASNITTNNAKTGITSTQASNITTNNAKTGITSGQASAISANTLKTGITSGQASAISANTLKTGITSGQSSAITANTSKVGYTEALVSANTNVAANTSKVGYTEALVSANTNVAANTAKTGITSGQASAIAANTSKVGYTEALVSANTNVTANTAKVGYTEALVSANTNVAANTAKISNADHTGEVTGSTALTIATNIVDEDNLKIGNTPINGQFLICSISC